MTVFDFARHRLDTVKAVLSKDGLDVGLRRKSFQLLTYLLENRGRVVGKDELVNAVWPSTAVTDDSLTQCIKDIRRTLGPEADTLIRTVPRRGYRLDDHQVEASEGQTRKRRMGDTARVSIAVLPFASSGGDTRQQWLSDGIAEDIITALVPMPELRVVSRNMSFAFRDHPGELSEVAGSLGVRYLLSGSARGEGDALRLTTQLVDAETGDVVWAERFDRGMGQIFAVQDEITAAVVARLKAELLPSTHLPFGISRPENLEAYLCFLRGRQLLQEWTMSHSLLGRKMFQRAAELETNYARAYSGIALCDTVIYEWRAGQVTLSSTIELANRALAIEPTLPEALAARGMAFFRTGDSARADDDFDRALTIDPECYEATFFRAFMQRGMGNINAAVALYARAATVRLDDYTSPNAILGLLGEGNAEANKWAAVCFSRASRAAELHPQNTAPLCRAAVALIYLDRQQEARNWLARAIAMDPDDPVVIYNAASVHAMLGEEEMAINALEKYLLQSDRNIAVSLIRHDREFERLQTHPRYRALLG
jgi:adenylate cyclase